MAGSCLRAFDAFIRDARNLLLRMAAAAFMRKTENLFVFMYSGYGAYLIARVAPLRNALTASHSTNSVGIRRMIRAGLRPPVVDSS
jgi:hypothetical protein